HHTTEPPSRPQHSTLPPFSLRHLPPPRPTLFPYTTLFRSPTPTVAATTSQTTSQPVGLLPVVLRAIWATLVGLLRRLWSLITMEDRKSTRLNSSHRTISYAVFCLKKKKT